MIDEFIVDNLSLMHYCLNKYKHKFYESELFDDFSENFMPDYIRSCKNFKQEYGVKFSSYLMVAVANYYYRYINRNSTSEVKYLFYAIPLDKINENNALPYNCVPTEFSLKSIVNFNILHDFVKETMSENMCNIFEWYFIYGYSQSEIAEFMCLSQHTISKKLLIIKDRLKNYITE